MGAAFRVLLAALALLAVSASPRLAQASPEDLFGYGTRSPAMGATGIAHARGWETAFANPALASLSRDRALVLGLLGANLRLDVSGASLPGRTREDPVRGVLIGVALPIPLGGVLADRVGLALGFYTPTQVIVRGRVLYPEKTQFPILSDRAQSLTLRAGLGADVGHGVRLGVGVAALAELDGRVVAATDASGRVGTRVETQLVAVYAPTFGAAWETTLRDASRLRLGLVARGALDARFSVVIDGTKLSSLPIPLFDIAGIAQYDPAQLALEAAREDASTTLAVQIAGKRWSAFPGLVQPTVVCSDGSAGACGITPPRIDWRDTFVVRAGAERRVALTPRAKAAVRAGVAYETSPLPSTLPVSEAYARAVSGTTTVPTAYFDSDRVVGSLGVGIALDAPLPLDVDLFAQWHTLLPRTIRSVDDAGVTRLEGESSGHIAVVGLSAGVRF